MRSAGLVFAVSVVGCGSTKAERSDAQVTFEDARAVDTALADDAMPDAEVCQPRMLLAGGTDVEAQGWTVIQVPPAQLSYGQDHVHLQTTTATGVRTSGQLLLHHPGAFEVGKPFTIQIVMLVESVNAHNLFDSAAAILGAFTAPSGSVPEREQMIYLDDAKIGWADDTQSFDVQNDEPHTYELSVDAAGVARVTVDGTPALMRSDFVFNGALAIGDQTNDANIDSALRIFSVTKLCP
jgi:hypothetical protein